MTVIHGVTAIYRAVIYRFDCIASSNACTDGYGLTRKQGLL